MRHFTSTQASDTLCHPIILGIVLIIVNLCSEKVPYTEANEQAHCRYCRSYINGKFWLFIWTQDFFYGHKHVVTICISIFRPFCCGFVNHLLQAVWNIWIIVLQPWQILFHHTSLNFQVWHGCRVVRSSSRKHLMEQHSERVNVRAHVKRLTIHLFRTHVCRRAHRRPWPLPTVYFRNNLCDTKIHYLYMPFFIEENVAWFDVAVDDAMLMSVRESMKYLFKHRIGLLLNYQSVLLGYEIFEGATIDIFHYQEHTIFVLNKVEELHDVRVIQWVKHYCLLLEFCTKYRVVGKLRM